MKTIAEYGLTAPISALPNFQELALYFCLSGIPKVEVDFSDYERSGDYDFSMGESKGRKLDDASEEVFIEVAKLILAGAELDDDSEDTAITGSVVFDFTLQQVKIKYSVQYSESDCFSEDRTLEGRFDEVVLAALRDAGVATLTASLSGGGDSGEVNSTEAQDALGQPIRLSADLENEVSTWADDAFGRMNADICNNDGGRAEITLSLTTLRESVEGSEDSSRWQAQTPILVTELVIPLFRKAIAEAKPMLTS